LAIFRETMDICDEVVDIPAMAPYKAELRFMTCLHFTIGASVPQID
jgi:hypothetical protein